MSTRFVIAAAVGIVVGVVTENPVLGFQAFSLTYGVTGFLDPNQQVRGPRLDDLKAPKATYGTPIPYVEGAPRLAGVIAWASDKRAVEKTETQGKGGPGVDSTTYTYEMDVLYELAINRCAGVRRIYSNGKLIWNASSDAASDTKFASESVTAWREIRFYDGSPTQLPDPVYEAAVGVGNAPAYRGRTTLMVEGLNLGPSGQLPILTFEIATEVLSPAGGYLLGNSVYADDYRRCGPIFVSAKGIDQHQYIWTSPYDPMGARVVRTDFDGNSTILQDYANGIGTAVYSDATGSIDVPAFLTPDPVDSFTKLRLWTDLATFTFTVLQPSNSYGGSFRWARRGVRTYLGYGARIDFFNTTFLAQTYAGFGAGASILSVATDGTLVYVTLTFTGVGDGFIHCLDGSTLAPTTNIALPPSLAYDSSYLLLTDQAGTLFVAGNFQGGAGTFSQFYRRDGATWTLLNGDLGPNLAPGDQTQGNANLPRCAVFDDTLYVMRTPGSPTDTGAPIYTSSALPRGGVTPPTLADVVTRLCLRTKQLTTSDIDVSALGTDLVRAMAITQVSSTRTALEMLMGAYLFEAAENQKIRFVKRGAAPALTVDFKDLGTSAEGDEEPLPAKRNNDIELPAQVTVKYANVLNDFQDGAESGDRLVTDSTAVSVIELPIGFTPTEAKRLADANTMDLASSIQSIGPISLPRTYSKLEPTDVILLVNESGDTFRGRIVKATLTAGAVTFDLLLDDATAIVSVAGTDLSYSSSTLVRRVVSTEFELLDIPILRDADDGYGFYAAFGPTGLWPGAELDRSVDDVSYTQVLTVSDRTVFGKATTALPAFTGGNVFDEVGTVTVDVGDATLSSASRDTLLSSDANAVALGSQAAGWEIVQYRDAALLSPGVYRLSGLLRGRRGTEWRIASHVAGERVVALQTTGLRRVADQASDRGADRYWKAVTFGQSRARARSVLFADTEVGLKPYAPVDAIASKSTSGNITIAWHRRSRLGSRFLDSVGDPPLGEASEIYQVDIFDGAGFSVVVRTLVSAAPSVLYTTATQFTDFGGISPTVLYVRIYQMSAEVGRGYPLQATLLTDSGTDAFVPGSAAATTDSQWLGASGNHFLVGVEGAASGGAALGLYVHSTTDALLHYVTHVTRSTTYPYLRDFELFAADPATDTFVLFLRGQTSASGTRLMVRGVLPATVIPVVPSFLPSNPPFGLWWTGSEFRALCFDGHVWSSATGATWADQGAATGAPTPVFPNTQGSIRVLAGKLAMLCDNVVYTCSSTAGMAWTAATGDVAPFPTATYSDAFYVYAIAVNSGLAVILAIGKKPGSTDTWGLIYKSTDGAAWTKVSEAVIAGPVYYAHSAIVNTSLHPFGTGFVSDFWPIVPGSSQNDILEAFDFGSGVKLRFAYFEATYGRSSPSVGICSRGRYSSAPYFTSDLSTHVDLTREDL